MTAARFDLTAAVARAVREVAAEAVTPHAPTGPARLDPRDVHEKSPGELVTTVDRRAERLLVERLERLAPGVAVIGEEAAATDPSRARVPAHGRVWLVDPLDGTANFVAGSPHWAVMVALVEHGAPVASWIWRPVDQRLYVAERGAGATCNEQPLRRPPLADPAPERLHGAVHTRFLDARTAAALARNRGRFGSINPGHHCAGVDYPALAEGTIDFLLYWRTLPWDHAPGVLLAEEAGATVGRPDGTPYRLTQPSVGLLAAADAATWTAARYLLDDAGASPAGS